MRLREKVAVGLAMSMGVFAAACAAIKCTHLTMLSSPDFTYELSPIVIWSAAEAAATIMAACVPSLRVLARTARFNVKDRLSRRGRSMNTPYGPGAYSDKAHTQASTIAASLANTRPELRSRLSFERWAMRDDEASKKAHVVPENVIHVNSVIRLDWEPVQGETGLWEQTVQPGLIMEVAERATENNEGRRLSQ